MDWTYNLPQARLGAGPHCLVIGLIARSLEARLLLKRSLSNEVRVRRILRARTASVERRTAIAFITKLTALPHALTNAFEPMAATQQKFKPVYALIGEDSFLQIEQ